MHNRDAHDDSQAKNVPNNSPKDPPDPSEQMELPLASFRWLSLDSPRYAVVTLRVCRIGRCCFAGRGDTLEFVLDTQAPAYNLLTERLTKELAGDAETITCVLGNEPVCLDFTLWRALLEITVEIDELLRMVG